MSTGEKQSAVRFSVSIPQHMANDLNDLIEFTRIRQSDYFREALELLLEKYADKLREARKRKSKGG